MKDNELKFNEIRSYRNHTLSQAEKKVRIEKLRKNKKYKKYKKNKKK